MTDSDPTCRACLSPLNRGANRCRECGSFQGSRAWLNAVNDVISPIATAAGLIGIAIALWTSITASKNSKIEGSYFVRGEGLVFIFKNTGGAAATLLNSSFKFPRKEGRVWYGGSQSVFDLPDRTVRPNDILEVRLTEPDGIPEAVREVLPLEAQGDLYQFGRDEICTAQFVFADVSGKDTDLRIAFPCFHYGLNAVK